MGPGFTVCVDRAHWALTTAAGGPMTDTFSATGALLVRAGAGDQSAWNDLVEQHTRVLWSVARSYRLDGADAADVVQTTWLRLVEHLDRIEDPNRLVGWLVTTARRECLRVLRRSGRERPIPGEDAALDLPDTGAEPVDARLLTDERNAALWGAFARMPERCQRLLRVLMEVPARSYDEVSAALDMPIGSIGPTRARCLARLRTLIDGTLLVDGRADPGESGGRA
jgi:RNA polymerase sigma factor (sigma-70 family)